jgi:hypothetical protein
MSRLELNLNFPAVHVLIIINLPDELFRLPAMRQLVWTMASLGYGPMAKYGVRSDLSVDFSVRLRVRCVLFTTTSQMIFPQTV